jgi:pyruvate-formate lyase-activating enzyme
MTTAPSARHGGGSFRQVCVAGLPIYRLDCAEYAAFYAPGCLCVVDLAHAERFESTISPPKTPLAAEQGMDWAGELWRRAELAMAQASRWREGVFRPECLTLYMNNECNLRCVYCHTDPVPGPADRLDLATIAAAAEVVAENCSERGRPFYIVFHGGGEPTLHRERVERAMDRICAVASEHEVVPFRYIATNGVMSEEKAAWLAHRFDLIGLSCDGPADIHDKQRVRWDGQGTLHILERTAHVLHEEGCHLHVRTTITRASILRQAEIADYVCQQFSPEEIHFEPVYFGGRANAATSFDARYADEFATHFLEARAVARGYGVDLLSSGSRPGTLHGPYCNVFREVVNLVPGDGSTDGRTAVATACFKLTEAAQIHERGAGIGTLDRETGRFRIDHRRLRALCERLDATLPECDGCFNRYHCARECPDRCPLDDGAGLPETWRPGFRCQVQKAIASALLLETAERLWSEAVTKGAEGPHGTTNL